MRALFSNASVFQNGRKQPFSASRTLSMFHFSFSHALKVSLHSMSEASVQASPFYEDPRWFERWKTRSVVMRWTGRRLYFHSYICGHRSISSGALVERSRKRTRVHLVPHKLHVVAPLWKAKLNLTLLGLLGSQGNCL